jgi:hypothetical protein
MLIYISFHYFIQSVAYTILKIRLFSEILYPQTAIANTVSPDATPTPGVGKK